MDGAQENERNLDSVIVSANVHNTSALHVSFGGPQENRCKPSEGGFLFPRGFRRDRVSAVGQQECSSDSKSRGGMFPLGARGTGVSRRPVVYSLSLQRGQSLVELALVLPLLLLLLVGVLEIGRFAYYDILVANAARAGAQYGSQSLTAAADVDGISTAAKNDGLASLTVTPSLLCGCSAGSLGTCPTGNVCANPLVYIQVTASETDFKSLFSYPGLPATMTLSSTVTMRVSQ